MRSLHAFLLGCASLGLLAASARPQGDAFPAPPQKEPVQTAPTQPVPSTQPVQPVPSAAVSEPVLADAAGEVVVPPPVVLRYTGSWQEGYDALRSSYEEGDLEEALATADALLQPSLVQLWRELTLSQGTEWKRKALRALEPVFEKLGLMQPGDTERAELRYAHGVLKTDEARLLLQDASAKGDEELAESALSATEVARENFLVARALAGPGELRRDATYSQSRVMAERAEEARLSVPEIREKLGLPALPPPAQAGPPQAAPPQAAPGAPNAAEQPDPDADLKAVRGLYLEAREPLLERVLLGAYDDEDVQANLELIQRRLRELAAIERQREEQEQEQQDQNQDPSESDENDEQEENEEESEQDKGEGENQESDSPSDEQEPEEPQEEEGESKEEEQSEGETPETEQEMPQDQPAEEAERFLTREEALRLLDRLEQIEEEGEKVRQQVRSGRRKPVDRDW